MRAAILFLFIVFTVALVASAKRCKKQEDCESDECCVRLVNFVPPTCQKYKQKGDICLSDVNEKEGDLFKFVCPCAEGLQCKPQKEEDHNGVVNFLKDRCE